MSLDPVPHPATATMVEARDARVQRYLDHVQFEKRLAQRTLVLYGLDMVRLEALARAVPVDQAQVHSAHVRRWVAQMHAQGRSARGIALILSGWRGFYAWLAREALVATNPVQGVRPPKGAKPLPSTWARPAAMSSQPWARRLSCTSNPTNSATRKPLPYSSSTMAASRASRYGSSSRTTWSAN